MLKSQLKKFRKIVFIFIFFFYLISNNLAIGKNKTNDFNKEIENSINNRELNLLKTYFNTKESSKLIKRIEKILDKFPNSKWDIKNINTNNDEFNLFKIKITGSNIIDKKKFILESNFDYSFSMEEGKISQSSVSNLLTTIRNDQKNIDVIFSIPNQVLTGSKYDIDIIIQKPLDNIMVAGGIISHQEESVIPQEITLEPLVAGGIFKMTRAPSKPGIQIWSGIIAHPEGMITFTKTVDIVENL
tara:strand:- start:76 stop:807 length:732 start_codon:yes stop_codon:yes gene_type:complete